MCTEDSAIVLNGLRYQTGVGEALGDIVMPLAVF